MYSTIIDLVSLISTVYFLNKLSSSKHRFTLDLSIYFLVSIVILFFCSSYEVSKSLEGYLLFFLMSYTVAQLTLPNTTNSQSIESKSQTLISYFFSIASLSFLTGLFIINFNLLKDLVVSIPRETEISKIPNIYFYPNLYYLVSTLAWILYINIVKSPFRLASIIIVLTLSFNFINSKFLKFQNQITLPTIFSIYPAEVNTNQEVILKGLNFGNGGGESAVLINNIKHEVVNWSETQISFKTNQNDSRSGYVKIQNATGKDSVSVTINVKKGND